MGKTKWRTEPTNNEKLGDELWVGVKGQSNLEIAGSLRNSFRASVVISVPEVEHWMGEGVNKPTDPNQTPNAGYMFHGSQATRDKLRGREGNNPDHQLRPLRVR